MANHDSTTIPPAVDEGIEALKEYLGSTHETVLASIPPLDDEWARFKLILPTDYLDVDRVLTIGFGKDFPRSGLTLKLSPSPELDWPHTLYDMVCLFGIGQKPPYGNPKAIVLKTMGRFSHLITLVIKGSDPLARQKEFDSEVVNYWAYQLKATSQQLILLNRPRDSGFLYVLSDQRWRPGRGEQYHWLANDARALQDHLARLTGIKEVIKAPVRAAYYLKLISIPSVKLPSASGLKKWLTPHIDPSEIKDFEAWLQNSNKLTLRWLIFKLPGNNLTIQSIAIVDSAIKAPSNVLYGKRSDRKKGHGNNRPHVADKLLQASIHQVTSEAIHSRNPAYSTRGISKKKVLMVGLGSLGSKVTMELVREGIEDIYLIDPDRLADGNLGRHILGADDLGRQKVIALQEMINRDMPLVKVRSEDTFLQIQLLQDMNFLDQFDLIVITTADRWSEELLGVRKKDGGKWGLVQGWSEPHALVGHVLSQPGTSTSDSSPLFDDAGNFKHSFTEFPDHGYIPLPGCGAGFIPGGPLGLSQIAAMIARVSIDILTDADAAPSWHYWIGDTSQITELGGAYKGPALPDGITSAIFKQKWPDTNG